MSTGTIYTEPEIYGIFTIDLKKIARDNTSQKIQRGRLPNRIQKKFDKSNGRYGHHRSKRGGSFGRYIRSQYKEMIADIPKLIKRYTIGI